MSPVTPSTNLAIGRMFSASMLEDEVVQTLQDWQLLYLAEIERQTGRDPHSMPPIRSWIRNPRERDYVEDQVPAVIIVVERTDREPTRTGESYQADFGLGLGIIVSASDRENTLRLVKDYTAALRTLIVQQLQGGIVSDVTWKEDMYQDAGVVERREWASAVCSFVVSINAVVQILGPASTLNPQGPGVTPPGGPVPGTVPTDPYGTLPGDVVITHPSVTITKEP